MPEIRRISRKPIHVLAYGAPISGGDASRGPLVLRIPVASYDPDLANNGDPTVPFVPPEQSRRFLGETE